jgi:hypothetical protein
VARAFKSVGIKTVLIFGVHIQTRAGITYCVAICPCMLRLKFSGGRILSDLRNKSREYNTGARHCYQISFLVIITMNVCCTSDGEAVVCAVYVCVLTESTGLT